jgi:hypothetical protein
MDYFCPVNLKPYPMKNILTVIVLLCVILSVTVVNGKRPVENGKLSGVVTYKDGYGSSNQADAGSEIYAISESDAASSRYYDLTGVMERFQLFKSEYSVTTYSTIDPARVKKAQDNFNNASDLTTRFINGFKQLPAVIKAKANGDGKYALNLRPGKYYVVVVSGNVKSSNSAERNGNIDFKTVEIRSAGESSLDFNFEKHEMMWIRFITAQKRPGC